MCSIHHNYFQRYLKYKKKYLSLKKQLGGTETNRVPKIETIFDFKDNDIEYKDNLFTVKGQRSSMPNTDILKTETNSTKLPNEYVAVPAISIPMFDRTTFLEKSIDAETFVDIANVVQNWDSFKRFEKKHEHDEFNLKGLPIFTTTPLTTPLTIALMAGGSRSPSQLTRSRLIHIFLIKIFERQFGSRLKIKKTDEYHSDYRRILCLILTESNKNYYAKITLNSIFSKYYSHEYNIYMKLKDNTSVIRAYSEITPMVFSFTNDSTNFNLGYKFQLTENPTPTYILVRFSKKLIEAHRQKIIDTNKEHSLDIQLNTYPTGFLTDCISTPSDIEDCRFCEISKLGFIYREEDIQDILSLFIKTSRELWKAKKLFHGDLHCENVFYRKQESCPDINGRLYKQLVIFDFDASTIFDHPQPDTNFPLFNQTIFEKFNINEENKEKCRVFCQNFDFIRFYINFFEVYGINTKELLPTLLTVLTDITDISEIDRNMYTTFLSNWINHVRENQFPDKTYDKDKITIISLSRKIGSIENYNLFFGEDSYFQVYLKSL